MKSDGEVSEGKLYKGMHVPLFPSDISPDSFIYSLCDIIAIGTATMYTTCNCLGGRRDWAST